MNALLLALAVVTGQTMYEWIDSSGESHFTDDASTIPKGAKRKTLDGLPEVSRMPTDRRAPTTTPAPKQPPRAAGPDSCQRALIEISKLESQLSQNGVATPEDEKRVMADCEKPRRHGDASVYAQCIASRQARVDKGRELQQRLAEARENHRRAQVDGCR